MLAPMLRNLLRVYDQEPDEQKAQRVRSFLDLLENEQPNPESPR